MFEYESRNIFRSRYEQRATQVHPYRLLTENWTELLFTVYSNIKLYMTMLMAR